MANSNAGPAGPNAQDVARQVLAALAVSVGRFQSPELWISQDVTFAAPNTVQPARQMPLSRPAESILLTLAFRITVANNNMTAVAPEAPQSILQLIQLNGTHQKYGALQPIRMSGATAYVWPELFQQRGNYCEINGVRSAPKDVPFATPFLGNVGTYDVLLVWNVPLGPLAGLGQSTKRDLASYLYQAPDWGDTLNIQLNFGDASALGTPAAAGDVTFSAFGSAAGNPNMSLFVNYSIMGPFADQPGGSGVVVRQEQFFNQFVTAGNSQRITQLQKQITTGVILKQGTQLAGTTAGVQVFGTLVDTILARTMMMVDNKPLKFNQSNPTMRAYLDRMFGNSIPGGYFMESFVEAQAPTLAYRADGLAGGASWELQSDILTTGATQLLGMTQEMVYGGPFPPLRSSAA